MILFNEIVHVIDKLPEEFRVSKEQFMQAVTLNKKQKDFVNWGVRYTKDLANDLEKIKGEKS